MGIIFIWMGRKCYKWRVGYVVEIEGSKINFVCFLVLFLVFRGYFFYYGGGRES